MVNRKRSNGRRAKPRPSGPHFTKKALAAKARRWFDTKPTDVTPVERHADERGEFVTIENVESFRGPIGAVAVLTRKAGYVFAEHLHANEGHTVYVVSGKVKYREQKLGDTVREQLVEAGQAVFTPPAVPHAFLAVEDSTCVVVANITRTQEEYERDVKRLPEQLKLFSKAERRSTQAELDLAAAGESATSGPDSAGTD